MLTKALDCQERKDGAGGKLNGPDRIPAQRKDCGHAGSPNSGLVCIWEDEGRVEMRSCAIIPKVGGRPD